MPADGRGQIGRNEESFDLAGMVAARARSARGVFGWKRFPDVFPYDGCGDFFVSDSADSALFREIAASYDFFAALAADFGGGEGLGGSLVYAGKLDDEGAALLRAANIAGAASLAVSDSATELKQALRGGVVDYLVSTLDEALRILKNEIRKRLAVSVAIQAAPGEIGQQMLERGVQPDLLAARAASVEPLCARAAFLERGARLVEAQPVVSGWPGSAERLEGAAFRIWSIPAHWKPQRAQLDAQLAELLPEEDFAARRWLLRSPRYLAPQARLFRSAFCRPELAARIEARLAAKPSSAPTIP